MKETGDESIVNLLAAEELLLATGRERGWLSIQEIAESLQGLAEEDTLQDILKSLAEEGIAILSADTEPPILPDDDPSEHALDEEDEDDLQSPAPQQDDGVEDAFSLLLRDTEEYVLLTAAQEVDLAQRIERGREAARELADAPPNARKTLELLVEDGKQAFDLLTLSNIRLVISVARKYIGRGLPLADLVQEGFGGLMKAARKFDWRRGHKFSTYATWWIRQSVSRAISDQSRTVRLPVHLGDQINKFLFVEQMLSQKLGRFPTLEEIAQEMKVEIERVHSYRQLVMPIISLNAAVGNEDEDEDEVGDFIADIALPNPESSLLNVEFRNEIELALARLSPKEQLVIRLRFGFYDGQPHPPLEVARKLGLSRLAVMSIENNAIRKLRQILRPPSP